jgi:hypothetical protein
VDLLLAIALLTWLVGRAFNDARVDHTYAKQGLVSPRLEHKYGTREKAASMVAKYGFLDFLRDAWRDYWPRRTEALIAARNAKAADPGGRVRLRDRWAAARRAVEAGFRRLAGSVQPALAPTDAPAPTPVAASDLPPGTWTIGENGQRIPLTDDARPPTTGPQQRGSVASGTGTQVPAATTTPPASDRPRDVVEKELADIRAEKDPPGASPTPTPDPKEGNPMTPTGEATDIQSAVSQAQALHLSAIAMRERILADLVQYAKAVETLNVSALGMEVPPAVQGQIDRTREALAALVAAVTGTAEEVTAAMKAVENEFAKHLPVVEQAAGLGGLAKKEAYAA